MGKGIYEHTLEKLREGGHYSINLLTKTLKVNNEYIIKNGKRLVKEHLSGVILDTKDGGFDTRLNVECTLNNLYRAYKYSIPQKRRQKEWFKALKYSELEDKTFGEQRKFAQFKLEYAVLECSIAGLMQPLLDKIGDGFFWIGEDTDFVILKSILINNNNNQTNNSKQ